MTDAASPAREIAAAVRNGEVSAVAVTGATLDRIARLNPALNAFTEVTSTRALAEARRVDDVRAAGGDPGPLAGVPFAVKNLFDVRGLRTLAGSKINASHPCAEADATLIERLNAAGAILVGALNMGEYAYDFTGENRHYGPSRNPHDPRRMSGGSSGGSGAAAAAGMACFTLGSDTNGSIRVPSSLCGLFGLKPTFGRLSRAGTFPFCASLDHVGPLARSAADLALAYDAMQGFDARDPVSARQPADPALPTLGGGIDGLRIAVAGGYFAELAGDDALAAVDRAADAAGAILTVELPDAATARSAAYVITATEASALHRKRLAERPMDFDEDVRDRLFAGALAPAQWYVQAQRFRSAYRRRVMALFEEVDIVIAPATPCTAPAIGQKTFCLGTQEMAVRANLGIFTQPISFIGLPVVTAPIAGVAAMPIAVQIVAAPWREADALRVAAALEAAGVAAAPVAAVEAADA
jgi:aspartyl-tRNA(Asn)/glutamyl-tRNA(Gln) amidotransferase subunit A